MKWKQTTDYITNGVDTIDCNDNRSIPIYLTHNYGVIYGNNGNPHASIGDNSRKMMCTINAMRIVKDGERGKRLMNHVKYEFDLSTYEKMIILGNVLDDDIYERGRCYDLSKDYNCIIVALWCEKFELECTEDDIIEDVSNFLEIGPDCKIKILYKEDSKKEL